MLLMLLNGDGFRSMDFMWAKDPTFELVFPVRDSHVPMLCNIPPVTGKGTNNVGKMLVLSFGCIKYSLVNIYKL